jgi:hypothetical protein
MKLLHHHFNLSRHAKRAVSSGDAMNSPRPTRWLGRSAIVGIATTGALVLGGAGVAEAQAAESQEIQPISASAPQSVLDAASEFDATDPESAATLAAAATVAVDPDVESSLTSGPDATLINALRGVEVPDFGIAPVLQGNTAVTANGASCAVLAMRDFNSRPYWTKAPQVRSTSPSTFRKAPG